MTIYLAIRSDSAHTRSISTERLVAQLNQWPELKKTESALFNVIREGKVCACLDAFSCSPEGNYAVYPNPNGPPPAQVNLIELRYSYEECEHEAWYSAVAVRVAKSLGWEAWGVDDDGRDLQLWPK
jgi:hypothetical protein